MLKFSPAVLLLFCSSIALAGNVTIFDPKACAVILQFAPGGKSLATQIQPQLFEGSRTYTRHQTRYVFDHPEATTVRLFARVLKTPDANLDRLGTPIFWINVALKSLAGEKRESATITRIDKNPYEQLDQNLSGRTRVSRYLEFTLEDAAHFEAFPKENEHYLSPAPQGEFKDVPQIPMQIRDSEFAATMLSRYWFDEFMMEIAQITRNPEAMRADRVGIWKDGRITINLTGLNYSEIDHILNLIHIRLSEAQLFAEKARRTGS